MILELDKPCRSGIRPAALGMQNVIRLALLQVLVVLCVMPDRSSEQSGLVY